MINDNFSQIIDSQTGQPINLFTDIMYNIVNYFASPGDGFLYGSGNTNVPGIASNNNNDPAANWYIEWAASDATGKLNYYYIINQDGGYGNNNKNYLTAKSPLFSTKYVSLQEKNDSTSTWSISYNADHDYYYLKNVSQDSYLMANDGSPIIGTSGWNAWTFKPVNYSLSANITNTTFTDQAGITQQLQNLSNYHNETAGAAVVVNNSLSQASTNELSIIQEVSKTVSVSFSNSSTESVSVEGSVEGTIGKAKGIAKIDINVSSSNSTENVTSTTVSYSISDANTITIPANSSAKAQAYYYYFPNFTTPINCETAVTGTYGNGEDTKNQTVPIRSTALLMSLLEASGFTLTSPIMNNNGTANANITGYITGQITSHDGIGGYFEVENTIYNEDGTPAGTPVSYQPTTDIS